MTISQKIKTGLDKALRFALWGTLGSTASSLCAEIVFLWQSLDSNDLSFTVFRMGLWFGLIGLGISVALLIANSQYSKRRLRIQQALQDGILLGFFVGMLSGGTAQFIYSSIGPTEILRVICWGIAGFFLGSGLSLRIPNLGWWRGAMGGAVGGTLGGALFVLIGVLSKLPEFLARLIGLAAIGFCIGLMIVIAEVAFRDAWLEVRYGTRETRTVSLGTQSILIGSDSNLCTLYARNTAPVALRYQLDQGQIICEDIPTGITRQIQPGDQRTVGNLTITVQAVQSTSHQRTATLLRLQIKYRSIPLTVGTRLWAKDIPGLEPQVSGQAVAEVNCNPKNPAMLGLKNCSRRDWDATLASGEHRHIPIGRSLYLMSGTQIDFGFVSGVIQA